MPPKKKARLSCPDNSSTASNDGKPSGFIRFEVKVADITPAGIFSPVVEVEGTPWKLRAYRMAGYSFLEVFLYHRKSDCEIWSIDVNGEIRLVNIDGGMDHVVAVNDGTYNHEFEALGFREFIQWTDLVDEEKGFIKDGQVIIEARFTLSKIIGIRVTPRADFSDGNDPCHDVVLVINGEKLHVNKAILSIHSPVFKAMFYGEFVEKNKKEIELKDIDREEFITMLHMIYPSNEKITDANAEPLLKLADRFQIATILDPVEQFLIKSTKLNITSKLNLSDEFRLVKLQDHCLDSLKSVQEIQNLKATDGYKELSRNIKATLLEKVMKLG